MKLSYESDECGVRCEAYEDIFTIMFIVHSQRSDIT